jgi:two-component system, NarL family, nitrate/nitrite response regulator NarL
VRSVPRRTRVFLADDHPMFLEAVVEAVRERPDLELVGSAGNGLDAVVGVRELRPDVVLLDMRLRGLSGQEVLDQALAEQTSTRFVFLSAYFDSELVYGALAGGASGYLSKDMDRDTICDAIVSVAAGETVLSPDVQRELAGAIRHRDVNERPPLTARERMVLALAAEGHSTREIAQRLGVASATVKTHLQSIYHKLDAPDRASAVAAAIRRGMLE